MARIRKDIQLLCTSPATASTSYSTTTKQYGFIEYDPALYDSVEAVYLEVSFRLIGGDAMIGQYGAAKLVDASDDSDITGSEVSDGADTTSTRYYRKRSGDIKSELSSATTMYVQYKCSSPDTTIEMFSVRLVIIQNGEITKTATHWNIGDYHQTTLGYGECAEIRRMLLDTDDYDGSLSYEFQASMKFSGIGSGYAELYDVDNTAQRGEVSTSSATWIFETVAATGLQDNAEHTVRIKVGGGHQTTYLANAFFVIKQTGTITKTVCPIHIYNCFDGVFGFDTNTSYNGLNYKFAGFDPADYDDCSVAVKHESSQKTSNATYAAYAQLLEDTSAITNSENNTNSLTYTRKLSAALTAPATSVHLTMEGKIANAAATWYCCSSRLNVYLTSMTFAAPRRIFTTSSM